MLHAFAPGGDTSAGVPKLDYLIGITSFGEEVVECATSQKPGVYTRIVEYLEWIEKETIDASSQTLRAMPPAPPPEVSNGPALVPEGGLLAPFPASPDEVQASSPTFAPSPPTPQEQRELNKVDLVQ